MNVGVVPCDSTTHFHNIILLSILFCRHACIIFINSLQYIIKDINIIRGPLNPKQNSISVFNLGINLV